MIQKHDGGPATPEQDDLPEVEEVDVETYAKEGKKPPKAKRYRFRIDKPSYVWPKPLITGAELLGLAGKDPNRCAVRQKLRGGQVKTIGPTDPVDLSSPGVERFMTLCHDQQDG